jgi:multiple PDZ domain protein
MPLNADISTALQLLEHIQHTIDVSDDAKPQAQTSDDLNLLISVLENPILRGIVSVQVRCMQTFYIFGKLQYV